MEVPAVIVKCCDALDAWLSSLVGKSGEEIEWILGAPHDQDVWDFQDADHPVHCYSLVEGSELQLYLFGGEVMTASLQVLSTE